ncbi:protocadherin Fat 4-like, partial [Haliotis rubra]|uniref:protocadherin Fat 4-like n=1 Tax=Haliotis rubra TaxID=36100 RepID=UPI001EE5723B
IYPENEFAPVWSSPSVNGAGYFPGVTVDEDVSPDYDVVTVTATDADPEKTVEVTYSITSVVSGEVTLIASPTGVAVTNLVQSIPLLVSDQGTPNLQGKGHLLVLFENCQTNAVCSNDSNVYTPTFSKSLHTVAVPENTTGDLLILTFTATDADNGTNGQFTFNISDGNNDGLFRLDGDDLYVQVVDYESASSIDFTYSLTVTAADQRYFPGVTVDEDVSPDYDVVTAVTATDADLGEDGEVTYSITSVVSESLILTFTATDGDNGTNGQFSFNIIDGNNDGLFRLDGDNLYVQVVDYEGSASISPQNEFDPVYQSPKPDSSGEFPVLTVNENEPLGYEVIVVTATDADLGVDGHVVYSIESVLTDAGASEPNKFTVDPSTGRLTTSSHLDFDPSTGGTAYYNVTIAASDMGSSPRSATVLQTVIVHNINDIQPTLSVTMTTVNVPCGTAGGASLVTLTAVDEDGPNLSFAIDSGSNPYVSVSSSGEVTLLSSPVGSAVDDLVENIQVVVSDGGTPELTVTGHVQILFENCGNSTVCPSVTTATTTVAPTCDCSNITTTEDNPPSRSANDVIETWVMRAVVMMLTAALFGVLAMHFRPKTPTVPQKSSGKVFPRETTLERGIQDDSGKPFEDDLEHHFLHK